MKVLVTGATSGLGRNAVEWLLAAGHTVYATGRDRSVGEQLRQAGAVLRRWICLLRRQPNAQR